MYISMVIPRIWLYSEYKQNDLVVLMSRTKRENKSRNQIETASSLESADDGI